ncbi:MAG: RNA-binding S4 domain-containing protein [Verrucomicrobia bacterium]|nr:MAG: RNA-binding S4 domain-containing protein [Verrucomicrobiota bacterium]
METASNPDPALENARLDKWLWMVRGYKTRAEAAEACRNGRVQVQERVAKPAHTLRGGQRVSARQGLVTRRWVVLGLPKGRVSAGLVPEFAREETSLAELAAAREQQVQQALAGGSSRPTKRDRRARDTWLTAGHQC